MNVHGNKQLVVVYDNFFRFTRSLATNLSLILVEPIAIFICLGIGLNLIIDNVQGQKYSDFLFPGLIMATTMIMSFYSSSVEMLQKVFTKGDYHNATLAAVDGADIIEGEIFWTLIKAFFVGLVLTIFIYFFGTYKISNLFLSLPIVILNCLWSIGLGMVILSYLPSTKKIIFVQSVLFIPLYFVSGTFYPTEQLPVVLQKILVLIPLTHSAMASREILRGEVTSLLVMNILVLVVASYLLIFWGQLRLKKMYLQSYKEK